MLGQSTEEAAGPHGLPPAQAAQRLLRDADDLKSAWQSTKLGPARALSAV